MIYKLILTTLPTRCIGICGTGNGICGETWTGNSDLGKFWAGKWDLDLPSGHSRKTRDKHSLISRLLSHSRILKLSFTRHFLGTGFDSSDQNGGEFVRLSREKNMMEFDYTGNDLQDLSEWTDSLDFEELCDQSEVRDEPLAKRQKTAEVDDGPQIQRSGR